MNPEDQIINTLESGVPLSEQLSGELFLAIQKARIEGAAEVLRRFLEVTTLNHAAVSYLSGLERLLMGTANDMNVLIRAKTRAVGNFDAHEG
jgi:hypothetical protein